MWINKPPFIKHPLGAANGCELSGAAKLLSTETRAEAASAPASS